MEPKGRKVQKPWHGGEEQEIGPSEDKLHSPSELRESPGISMTLGNVFSGALKDCVSLRTVSHYEIANSALCLKY